MLNYLRIGLNFAKLNLTHSAFRKIEKGTDYHITSASGLRNGADYYPS